MNAFLYALHDVKADAFSSYNVQSHDAVASRAFQAACLAPDSMLASHPDDFQLVCLGAVPSASSDYTEEPMAFSYRIVVTARQVVDLSAKAKPSQLEVLGGAQ